jgi:hypothetical protein
LPTTTPSIFSTILIWLRRFTNQIRCNNSTTIELENIVLVQLLRRSILSTITTKNIAPSTPRIVTASHCIPTEPEPAADSPRSQATSLAYSSSSDEAEEPCPRRASTKLISQIPRCTKIDRRSGHKVD